MSPFQDDSFDAAAGDLDARTWGNSSTNFRFGGCMWCHPGGGALEYDRDGYRYDAVDVIGGANPNRTDGANPVSAVSSDGTVLATNPAGIRYGDYWVFDAASDGLVSKAGAFGKGVTEIDCLMCHYNGTYNNQARDFCSTKPGALAFAPKLGPSMALTLSGEVTTTAAGNVVGENPSCDILSYADGIIESANINKTPLKENCGLCHFPDNLKPNGKGSADAPLDWTTFQKHIPASDFTDSDIVDSVLTGGITQNVLPYNITKGRAEMGKRGFGINDAGSVDRHMDFGLTCSDCHYALSGDFPAYEHDVDGDGIPEVIQIAKTGIVPMDHQFAKGNNRPDGKNMDQLDNTITCEACHIPGTHYGNKPGSVDNGDGTMSIPLADGSTRNAPVPTHPAFPAFHMDNIDCRTCHIPKINFLKKKLLADFSTTPYPLDFNATTMNAGGIGRGQFIIKKIDHDNNDLTPKVPVRIEYKPIYAWLDRTHGEGDLKLTPISIGAATVWKDLASGLPYAQRFAGKASKTYRTQVGDVSPSDGYADFSLNNPQNGDTAIIANTTTEIAGMVDVIRGLGKQGMDEPALNIFINQFTVSHNVENASAALGSSASGGCNACHSSTSPIFSNAATDNTADSACEGQPEGCQGLVFFQPTDPGADALPGLEMTCDGGNCDEGTKRISGGTSFPCRDGSTAVIDLTADVAHGAPVKNAIPQEDVTCYEPYYLGLLQKPQTSSYFANLNAKFNWYHSQTTPREIAFDGTYSDCPTGQTCTMAWDLGDGNTGAGAQLAYTYAAAGDYVVTMTLTDEHGYTSTKTTTVTAEDLAGPIDPAISAVDAAPGDTLADAVLTVTAGENPLHTVYVRWNDGSPITTQPAIGLNQVAIPHTFLDGVGAKVIDVFIYDTNVQDFLLQTTVTLD